MTRSKIYIVLGILTILSFGVSIARPHAFQKLNTMVPAEGFEPLRATDMPVDIATIIANAPFEEGRAIAVEPARKYRLTVEEGTGNCSERAFGLAWKLRQSEIDLQIVHILPYRKFVRGHGHSVIRIPYRYGNETRVGVVDLLEGGLPTKAGEPLDIEDLTRGSIDGFALESLTERQDDRSEYYGDFLDKVTIGFIPAREIDRYFDFIERIYVPLGNDRVEKILYDGMALAFGVLPEVRVPNYAALMEAHRVDLWIHRSALWIQRLLFLVLPGVALFELVSRLRSKSRTQRGSDSVPSPTI